MIETDFYLSQSARWPTEGRHILAHYDEKSVVVYQAYRPSIGLFAIKHGRLGGPDFSFSRMSWIKPNFLWMMYRSGWGTKEGQEITLGLRIRREFFDEILRKAVPSTFDPQLYDRQESWKNAVASSEVRLQWDPDHLPWGTPLARKAIQLGLRGESLKRLAEQELLEVIDFAEIVEEGRPHATPSGVAKLRTPTEHIYQPAPNSSV